MGIKHFAMWALLLSPYLAHGQAQTVFKCRDAKGQPVYQSFPCGGDQLPEKTWSSRIRQPTVQEQWQRYYAEQKIEEARQSVKAGNARRRGVVWFNSASTGPSAYQQRKAGCEQAKAHRDRVLQQVGLKRNFDLLRDLDNRVYEACKGI